MIRYYSIKLHGKVVRKLQSSHLKEKLISNFAQAGLTAEEIAKKKFDALKVTDYT